MFKKIIFPALLIFSYSITHAQYAGWMIGTWKSAGSTSAENITNTIQITDVSIESFTGTKTTEINDHTKIVISISGAFSGRGLFLQDGEVIRKEPENAQWNNCSVCTQENKMFVSHDSLILTSSISGCNNNCDAETHYYRLLSEYDDNTQRYLVDRFGRPSDIIGFHPFQQQKTDTVASATGKDTSKNDVAASPVVSNVKKLQQPNESALLAQQKKRQREINDSLNLVQKKEQQHLKDSLSNVAKLEKIRLRTEDSLRDLQAKKRQQDIADSIKLVKQQEQQRAKDSLDNIARIRQQKINDSTLLAQQKKRDREIADSINLAKLKEQQRIKDSLDNVARLEKIKQQTEDSLRNVQLKKRQQEVADSISLVNQREQQRIKDSLQNAVAANLQKQRTADSLQEIQAKKRQQEISDSLATMRRQQHNDSLQKAALAKAATPTVDSASSAKNKVLTTRTNVLLQTYHINSPDILIELFDNGEIDGDRVSVYHNNELIVSNQTLGLKAITVNVHADANNREHEFVLVAENLGSIPPNSALMRITAGNQTYKLSVNTDLKTNARIVFYYDGN